MIIQVIIQSIQDTCALWWKSLGDKFVISQSDPVLGIIPGLKMPKFLSLGLSRRSHILYTACYCDILCGLSQMLKIV